MCSQAPLSVLETSKCLDRMILFFPDNENQHYKGGCFHINQNIQLSPLTSHSPARVCSTYARTYPALCVLDQQFSTCLGPRGSPDFLGAPYVLPFSAMYLCEATLSLYISTRTTEPNRVNADTGTGPSYLLLCWTQNRFAKTCCDATLLTHILLILENNSFL